MKKTMKKVTSILLAAAMVITSVQYAPKAVSAADVPSAYSTIEAESHTSSNGVSKDTNANVSGGYNIGGLTNGKWASYDLNFDAPATGMKICYTSVAGISAGSVEVYVDSMNNEKVATVNLPNTNATAWENGYQTLSADLDKEVAEGTHTIYLKFVTSNGKGWVANVDYFTFVAKDSIDPVADGYVYNFADSGDGFKVVFEDENEYATKAVTYSVNVGGHTIDVSESGETIDLSGLGLVSGRTYNVNIVTKYDDGSKVRYSAPSETTTFVYNTAGTENVYKNGIAQVLITTSRNDDTSKVDLYTDTSKEKVNAAIVVKTVDGAKVEAADFGTVNVRGNSTSLAQKKAYNFKFDSKANLFKMGKAKKWSLLANIFDKASIRTQIGMKFQVDLEEDHASGNQFTSQCQPVELYIDGKYLGTYLLIESVETGGDRVDIDVEYVDDDGDYEEGKEETYVVNGKTYQINDILLELANDIKETTSRYDSEAFYFGTSLDEWFSVNEPERDEDSKYGYKVDDNNKPQFVKNTQTFLNDFESVIASKSYANDNAQFEVIEKYIDVESFVDFYITSELFMTKDVNFSSTRFYIEDGRLYAGPLWDLDLSSGNSIDHKGYEDFYAQDFEWFGKLMANDVFKDRVIARYTALQGRIQNIYKAGGDIEQAYEEIKTSAKYNYESAYNAFSSGNNGYNNGWGYNTIYGITHKSWTGDAAKRLTANNGVYGSNVTYTDYVSYVSDYKEWMKNRNEWLLEQWDITVTEPIEVFGEVVESPRYNTISVVWGQNNEQILLGQKYNVYVNGEIALENVDCNRYEITDVEAGTYSVRITAVLNGFETAGITKTVIVEEEVATEPPTTEEPTTEEETIPVTRIDGGIEINGYQISAGVQGMRTIYSVDSDIDGKEVVASGVVYSLSDYASESELYVGSTSNYVKNYESTSAGVMSVDMSDSDIATSYTMTMKFAAKNAKEYTAKWRVCAYAKLSDGTYVYSDAYEYTIYAIADYLHQGCKMNTQEAHDYLYTDILSVVEPAYKAKDYNWNNVIVGF